MNRFDVICLGGGAAGLMCAIVAGQRGRRVLVVESANKIGKKILMSGGGRCNFTNLNTGPQHFISANPHFFKSALSRYSPQDFVALVESHDIPYHEKTAGQLFCDRSSKDIVSMLADECSRTGVQIVKDCATESVSRNDKGFLLATRLGSFAATSLVVATGGLSIPKMGATDFGYRLGRQFGLNVLETRAGLVPLTFTGPMHDLCGRLAGVSTTATLATDGVEFTDDVLFTHRGLSGPAALQISSYWTPGQALSLNLLPGDDPVRWLLAEKKSRPANLLRKLISARLPRALVLELQALHWAPVADMPIAEIRNDELDRIGALLARWSLNPSGTEGYRTAEVTLGGIDTDELSSQSMECRRQPGLYYIGEVVDVTGHLGGFNFQWAWASAHAAGRALP